MEITVVLHPKKKRKYQKMRQAANLTEAHRKLKVTAVQLRHTFDGGTTETYSCGSSTEPYNDKEVSADESHEKSWPSIVCSCTSCQNCETILSCSKDSLHADFFWKV